LEYKRLNIQEIVHEYQENIETQIDKIEVRADINEEWTNIKTVIINSAKEIIGIRKKERNDWFDDECREIILEKNKSRNKCLNRNTRVIREEYEQKRSETRNLFKKKKRELLKKN